MCLSSSGISEGEKQSLRSGLLCTFQEPVNQVAIQVAVLIAKAARLVNLTGYSGQRFQLEARLLIDLRKYRDWNFDVILEDSPDVIADF